MNYPTISFTRSLHVAIHFAMLQRDLEETTGAILILDRELLRTRHKLVPYQYHDFDEPINSEAEEMVEAERHSGSEKIPSWGNLAAGR